MRFLSSRPDCVVAISESVARDIRSVSKCPGRITTVLNAIDIDHFSPDGPTWTSGPLPSVGLIATFARWKGHEVFLRAIASLPFPVHGYIAGGALYRTQGSQVTLQELKELAERLGLADRVTFTGFLEDPAPLLRSLDVIVHASIEPEPFGLTIAEAMACGKAVVASMAGGVTELIEPGVNGLGHAPGDVKGLALAIEHLLRDPDLRRQYGLAARAFASTKFSPARMARQFVEVYANC
jgi:glycosyltransferase involved in cell wall biosynthesis